MPASRATCSSCSTCASIRTRRLDARRAQAAEEPIRPRIEGALAAVPSLDEDRILRLFLNLVGATVRTNFYQTGPDGRPPETIAFKLDSKAVEAAPQPRPFREIWVYSPARRGRAPALRADRARRHPLVRSGAGLPHRGAGLGPRAAGQERRDRAVRRQGRVPAQAAAALAAAATTCRRKALRPTASSSPRCSTSPTTSTDGKIVPPPRVVRHDGDDPYLVVAADKGTATFSDIANEHLARARLLAGRRLRLRRLGGYDHKGWALPRAAPGNASSATSARWTSTSRRQPFRVIGVGDMSGDVFGNGMLLSEQIRLVAAFDHRDIFIDPEPERPTSFAERKRLFELPRSSWQDYDRAKISQGRRRVPALGQVDRAHRRDAGPARPRRGQPDARPS